MVNNMLNFSDSYTKDLAVQGVLGELVSAGFPDQQG